MIKAVIFDYGGVVKEGHSLKKDFAKIYNMPEEEMQKFEDKIKPIYAQFMRGSIDEKKFWQQFSGAIGKSTPNNCIELSRKIYKETFSFFPEILDLIEKLKEQGLKTAVLSNILDFQAEIIREKDGYKMFDVVALSYEEGLEKPELDFYKLIIERLGIKPEECIFIDDGKWNLPPAISLGMKTVLAKNPKQVEEDVFSIINLEGKN